jgi:hypothetical protein
MVKHVDNWYQKGKENDLNDVLYVVDKPKVKLKVKPKVKPREGVESQKHVIEIECATKTSVTDTPQPSILRIIDVSNDAYNDDTPQPSIPRTIDVSNNAYKDRLVKLCAKQAAELRKANSNVRSL